MTPRRERALAVAHAAGADGLLAADAATVTWLTGFEADLESGPSPFALPPLAVVTADGPPVLVVSEDDAETVEALGCEASTYPGFTVEPLDPVGNAKRALAAAADGRTLATEPGALPIALADGLRLVDAAAGLAGERAVKDPDELDLLRAALGLCDVGQREARAAVAAGLTELDVWARVRAAIEREAGSRTPILADLASGPRTGETGGAPGGRVLTDGDLVICDLVPRRAGYWGDSCVTLAVGEPGTNAREKHDRARAALERGLEALRPGVRAGELDALVREGLDYPHHTGHGLGTCWHEEPRIVPGGATVLEPGMVVALEPGLYRPAEGVRVEAVALVTGDGHELLSSYPLGL